MTPLTVRDIAAAVQGDVVGDAGIVISEGVASLAEAGPRQLSFLGNPRYQDQVLPSAAGCVLVPADFAIAPPAGRAWVRCANPSHAFGLMIEQLLPAPNPPAPGVHPRAVVAPDAQLGANVHVGPCAVIESGVVIGDRSLIEAGCYVGHDARIGADCRLWPNVTVRERCILGDRVIIHSGTVVGSDGFGYDPSPRGHRKLVQRGIVQIDQDVEIGANCALDRARFGRTWIKAGVKIDNLVQIAHNVVVGELSFLAAQTGIAGSTKVGRGVMFGGQSGAAGHLSIGDGAKVLGGSGADRDVPAGVSILGGPPHMEHMEALRVLASSRRLPDMVKKVRTLEKELAALRAELDAAADSRPAPADGP